jgi:hypothetical protein
MVTIPGGRFLLGLTEGEADALARELVAMEVTLLAERQLREPIVDAEHRVRERRAALSVSMPAYEVVVAEFAIDRFPVTVLRGPRVLVGCRRTVVAKNIGSARLSVDLRSHLSIRTRHHRGSGGSSGW